MENGKEVQAQVANRRTKLARVLQLVEGRLHLRRILKEQGWACVEAALAVCVLEMGVIAEETMAGRCQQLQGRCTWYCKNMDFQK